jgi:hypothetical protein
MAKGKNYAHGVRGFLFARLWRAIAFGQQALRLQAQPLFRRQFVYLSVAAALHAPDAIIEITLDPDVARANAGAAAFCHDAGTGMHEFDAVTCARGQRREK